MADIKIGEIITVDGINKELKITGIRYAGDIVELKTEELEG